ncbi:Fic domain-containing protein [Methanococcoides burtonii DSM 6242]|uniref:Fic domain-containing protein n=1 Tax=Methanococcoides burtonii (strain DSM 6242 / NBRC 107633 / OCM 468 / ACE-M) TaxID=259564 RepID=Q12VI9_METBU|nr:Fic domain-containing protein [Methanococcoides burtonii DSM 6242]
MQIQVLQLNRQVSTKSYIKGGHLLYNVYIEKRKQGHNTKYYLTHSYKIRGKTRKIRRYLGLNLNEADISTLRKDAEESILKELDSPKNLLKFSLTRKEILKLNEYDSDIQIAHLDPLQWKTFTETFVYNTNAIEGSTISPDEVHDILKNNAKARTDDELESIGVAEAVDYIRNTDEKLSISLILELHEMCFRESKDFAGKLRDVEVIIRDGRGNIVHQGIPSTEIERELNELTAWYNENREEIKPLLLAAILHNQFEYIHPFEDGNGRVGRLLLNYALLQKDYPPINILLEDRSKYYECLRLYSQENNLESTLGFLISQYSKWPDG